LELGEATSLNNVVDRAELGALQFGLWKFGFLVGTKLGVSSRLRQENGFGQRLGDHKFGGCCRGRKQLELVEDVRYSARWA
jgi:hypothetical protein